MRQSNWSKDSYISTNDRVGNTQMPIEGAEAPRRFLEGTGKRKYDINDKSVIVMRKNRSKQYKKFGIGVPGSSTTITGALTAEEMRRQKPHRFKSKKKTKAKSEREPVFTKPIAIPEIVNPYEAYKEREREKEKELALKRKNKRLRKLERNERAGGFKS